MNKKDDITFFEPVQNLKKPTKPEIKKIARKKYEEAVLRRDAQFLCIDYDDLFKGLTTKSFIKVFDILGPSVKEDITYLVEKNASARSAIAALKKSYEGHITVVDDVTLKIIIEFARKQHHLLKNFKTPITATVESSLLPPEQTTEEVSESLSKLEVTDIKDLSDEEIIKLGIEQSKTSDLNILDPEADNKLVNLGKFLDENNIAGVYSIKGQLLDSLIKKCLVRIKAIETAQTRRPDIDLESLLLKYIKEIRESLETIDKVSDKASEHDKKYIITVIQNEISTFIKLVKEVVENVCPEKKDVFLLYFKSKITSHFQNLMQLADKAVDEK